MTVAANESPSGIGLSSFWPAWYRRFVVVCLGAAMAVAFVNWLLNPGTLPPIVLVMAVALFPGVALVSIYTGSSEHSGRLIVAAILLDFEGLILAPFMSVGLTYAVLFPTIGLSLVFNFLRGRRLTAVVVAAGLSGFAGVSMGYLVGPAGREIDFGVPALTLINVGLFIALGLSYIALLVEGRSDALAAARAELASRREAENKLARTSELFAAVVESTPVPTQAFDADGNVILWNPASERVYGWKADEVLGRKQPPESIPPEDRASAADRVRRTLEGEVIQGDRIRRISKDGRDIWIDIYATAIHDSEGAPMGVAGQLVDVTERVALDERLRQAAKMEAIGVLAGGVAHDFNNMLTAIRGYAELARAEIPAQGECDYSELRSDLSEILLASDRAAELTRQLLAFARKSVVEPRVVGVADVVNEFAPMLRRLLGEHISLVLELAPDTGRVRVDPTQLQQVILNLAVNSRDAMPDGGKLVINSSRVAVEERYAASHPGTRPGPQVLLTVSDTGVGMDEETRGRVFEPFFTTKEPGRGTGMGMATVFGIVEMAGGWIEVESQLGAGTRVKLFLPRLAEGAAAEPAPVPLESIPRGHETILLVEDDPAVRWFGRRCLEGLGYSVLEAASGTDALRLAGCFPETIDLLVSDVMMPGMQGPELAQRILEVRPSIRTLFCSGLPQHGAAAVELGPGESFLPKPYSRSAIGIAVRKVLDKAG
jgi:PAS domain S-box-containing protein